MGYDATFFKVKRPASSAADLHPDNRASLNAAEVCARLREAFPEFSPWKFSLGCQNSYADRSGGLQFVLWLRDLPSVDHVHFQARGGFGRAERDEFVEKVCATMGWVARVEAWDGPHEPGVCRVVMPDGPPASISPSAR